MRERWLLQGMGQEEEEARRKQLELDEEQGKRLEEMIHRYRKHAKAAWAWFAFHVHYGIAVYVSFALIMGCVTVAL